LALAQVSPTDGTAPFHAESPHRHRRYIYVYDSRNRLVQVHVRLLGSGTHLAVCGRIFAKFSYNALGWRTTAAAYDVDGNGQLTDETITY